MLSSTPLSDLQVYTSAQLDQHNLPAVSLAVWHNGELRQAAAGILNQNTGMEATTDSVFQIGSITKVMTTCLVMQLVDEGRIDIDKPVFYYLQDFMIADAQATQGITVRQLLNHTSGIAGDYFPDDHGHQGNLIARYVDRCSLLPLVHSVGEMYSYSNAAFCVAGRLVEVVRGISWYSAMEEYIYKPLGMDHAIADPKDVIRYRCAMGHIYDGDNSDCWVLPERAYLTLGQAPVGSTPAMTAENLIRFARGFIDGGLNQQGERWLSESSVKQMKTPEIALPKTSQFCSKSAGLGWAITDFEESGLRIIGHGGATNGFLSVLQIIPERNAAFAILINGFRPSALSAIQNDLLKEIAGIEMEEPAIDKSPTLIEQQYRVVGEYDSLDKNIVVSKKRGQLWATIDYKIDPLPSEALKLYPITDECYACETLDGTHRGNWAFVMGDDPESPPIHLFDGSRLNSRC